MNILNVTMSMGTGGAETHVLELCRELNKKGHNVVLVSEGGVYADELVKEGIEHITLPLTRKDIGSVIESYKGLKKLILSRNFDIVHAHARIPAFICGLLHDRIFDEEGRKFRFVTTAHLDFTVNPLLRRISRWGERTMAVSDDIVDYLVREYGCRRNKLYVTVNGIDTDKFSPKTDTSAIIEKYGLKKESRKIVYISRLDEDRADPAYKLLGTSEKILKTYPDTEIIIVGGGGELEKIRKLADEANEKAGSRYITVTGPVSNVNEYCALADIFIGVSRSALEAMAAAKPVIVAGNQGSLGIFDESKIKDAVETNFCCRGFDTATSESLFGDISCLLEKPQTELSEIGTYNRNFILENYTVGRMADDYIRMYEETLRSPVLFSKRKGKPDAVISGYYGFGNLGDESLLEVISGSIAERVDGVKLVALTKKPGRESKNTGMNCAERFNLITAGSSIKKSKLLVSGGGSLLQDATSKRNLIYYAGIIKLAKRAKKQVCILANGIGPVNYESNRKLTKEVVESADYVSVRDSISLAELRDMGVSESKKVVLSADPTFMIKPCDEIKLGKLKRKLGLDGRYFAVSIRPVTVANKRNKGKVTEKDAKLCSEVADACCEISKNTGLVPLIIPMQRVQDTNISYELLGRIKEKGVRGTVYEPESADELLGILGDSEFTVGMRLHAIIFASSAASPVIGISYDPKIDAVMSELGQERVVKLDDIDNVSKTLKSYAFEVIENKKHISEVLSEKSANFRQRCEKDADIIAEMIKSNIKNHK